MKKMTWILSLLMISEIAAWASTPIGTAVLVKGRVGKYFGAHNVVLREGDKVEEGAVITTGTDGSAKILLLDNTELKIGPSSSFKVESLRSKEPPVVTLGKGELRTKVLKDPVVKENPRVKFLIRTRSATMGVRGTDFDTIYNPETKVTSVVTFEGLVSMIKTEAPEAGAPTPPPPPVQQMIAQVNDPKAVNIQEGNFSSAVPQLPQATLPIKISPAQFESLKNADPTQAGKTPPQGAGSVSQGPGKFFSPVPPGVDAKNFVGSGEGLEKQLKEKVGSQAFDAAAAPKSGPAGLPPGPPAPPPQGFYDAKTGAFAPPAGGFIDLKTGVYLPPPPGSAFDKNTGVYIPPPGMGGFDAKNGQFTPPPGTQLNSNGQFVAVEPTPGAPKNGQPGPFAPGAAPLPPGMMPPPPGGFPVAGYFPGMPPGGMPFMPGMMPPPGQPGMMPPPGGYMPPPAVPVVGGDSSCGAGCVPQGPPPGGAPPPLDPATSTQVQFSITVN